jgi:hypothetical protein
VPLREKGGLTNPTDIHTVPTAELMNKSISELKAMGAEEVMCMNFRHNKTTRKLEPKISADDKERLRKAMKMGTESLFDEDDNEVDDK